MALDSLGKWVLLAGLVLAAIGLLLIVAPKVPFVGRLPGDFLVKRDGFTFYFPLVTMVLVSLVLTLVLNLVARLFRS
jgi:hypothetical protein